MTKHTKLKNKLIKAIEELYPKSFIYCPVDFVRSGIPDVWWLINKILIIIKIYPDKLIEDGIQEYTMLEIKRAGGIPILIIQRENNIKIRPL